MATITRADVQHVARLARLGLTDEELDRMTSELSHILDAMQAQETAEQETGPADEDCRKGNL